MKVITVHSENRIVAGLIEELSSATQPETLLHVTKEADGRYRLTIVSTAAIADRTDETFTTEAMDYDIIMAKESGLYPEIRVFHSPQLGIGMIDDMRRVGIFAIDEGYSYTDEFSLAVCKELVENNNGKWRASRGFRAIEVNATCPNCNNALIITKEHMVIGFRCPSCEDVHLSYKGMRNVKYTKTRTFDVTVTDVPAVPMTSASAYYVVVKEEMMPMNKKELKQRLLGAGISEDVIDTRLETITDAQLKEYDDVPDAVLKEDFKAGDEAPAVEYMQFDAESIDAIADTLTKRMKELMEDTVFDIGDLEVELKEDSTTSPDIIELKEKVDGLIEKIDIILASTDELKEATGAPSRRALRIFKGRVPKKGAVDEDEEEEEDDEKAAITSNGTKVSKSIARALNLGLGDETSDGAVIKDGSGNTYKSMSSMLLKKEA